MNEVLVFPPIVGFALMALNILLVLTLLILGFIKLQKPQTQDKRAEAHNPIENPLKEDGFEILDNALNAFYKKYTLSDFLQALNTTFLKKTQADGAMILICDCCNNDLKIQSFIGSYPPPTDLPLDVLHSKELIENYYNNTQITLTNSMYATIFRERQNECIIHTKSDTKIMAQLKLDIQTQGENERFLQASSYIFIPLIIKNTSIGIICLAKNLNSTPFNDFNFNIAKRLSIFANMGLETVLTFNSMNEKQNFILQETIASEMQNKLYFLKDATNNSIELEPIFFQANGVCSDYFDIIIARKNRITFVLADVIGRGIKALFTTTTIRAMLRIMLNTSHNSSTMLQWLNRGLLFENTFENFASLILIDYNPEERTLHCTNAGENIVLYYSAKSKTWEKLGIKNKPIGISKDEVFTQSEKTINKDDIIVLCTDGLSETINEFGNQYSIERIKKNIEKNASFSIKTITQRLKHDIIEFKGNKKFVDDASLVVLKVKD